MKKIIFLIFALFSIISLKSQTTGNYPFFYIKGYDTLGVVFSVEQAQKIDNDYQLLSLLKKSKIQSDSLSNAYITIVNSMGQQIAELKLKISTLEEKMLLKDSEINNLKDQIELYKRDIALAGEQSANKDKIITNYKKENRKLKFQKFFGFTVGGAALIAVIVLLGSK
jgi:hypothetical protein